MNPTKKLMEAVAAQAAKIFDACEGKEPIMPAWIIEGENGSLTVIGTPFDGKESKAIIASLIKEKLKELKATRYAFVTKSWMVTAKRHEGIPESIKLGASVASHPDREEIIMVAGEERAGKSYLLTQHILRPEHGKPTLMPIEWADDTPQGKGGMFQNMFAD